MLQPRIGLPGIAPGSRLYQSRVITALLQAKGKGSPRIALGTSAFQAGAFLIKLRSQKPLVAVTPHLKTGKGPADHDLEQGRQQKHD